MHFPPISGEKTEKRKNGRGRRAGSSGDSHLCFIVGQGKMSLSLLCACSCEIRAPIGHDSCFVFFKSMTPRQRQSTNHKSMTRWFNITTRAWLAAAMTEVLMTFVRPGIPKMPVVIHVVRPGSLDALILHYSLMFSTDSLTFLLIHRLLEETSCMYTVGIKSTCICTGISAPSS